MDWLTDEAIEQFFEEPLLRVETNEIFRHDVGTAWVILDAEKRRYLGTVTRSGDGYYAFPQNRPNGVKVNSFAAAATLIELSGTSEYIEEEGSRRYVRGGVRWTKPVEES